MKFSQMLYFLHNFGKMSRETWDEDEYIILLNDFYPSTGKTEPCIYKVSKQGIEPWNITQEDVLNNDWKRKGDE